MSYFDDFKTLSTMYGDNSSEQRLSAMQFAFDQYFEQSPNKVTATIDATSEVVIIQHMKYGENFNDEKLLIALNDTVCKIGSKIVWGGDDWIVINYENRAITTHKAFKIGKVNNYLKWVNSAGITITEPCIVMESGLGFQDSARQVSETDSRRKVVVQYNSNTAQIKENYRFVLGKTQVYAITDIDDFTNEDELITFRMEKTQSMDADDFVNKIAYNGDIQYTPTPVNDIQFSLNEMRITKGYSKTVTVSEVGVPATTFTFLVTGLPASAYEITAFTGNSITIKCKEFYHVGALRATSNTMPTQYAEIPVILEGLF